MDHDEKTKVLFFAVLGLWKMELLPPKDRKAHDINISQVGTGTVLTINKPVLDDWNPLRRPKRS